MTVIRHVVVRGRVQGVGFRAFVEDEARAHGLAGWVRNRRDGSVESLFSGPPEKVDAVIAALRIGPPAARVDNVEINQAGEQDLRERQRGEVFSVLRTI